MNKIVKNALLDALGTFVYVVLVASLMSYLQANYQDMNDIVLITPIAMLMLFVFSAALTGFLVFGRPILMYLDGKKKDALSLLFWTLVFLFAITFIVFFVLLAMSIIYYG